jgi:hypothetical protein
MARPPKTIKSVYKNIAIPEHLAARLELELYSPVEGKIPHGAQQLLFTKLLEDYFQEQDVKRTRKEANARKLAKEIEKGNLPSHLRVVEGG